MVEEHIVGQMTPEEFIAGLSQSCQVQIQATHRSVPDLRLRKVGETCEGERRERVATRLNTIDLSDRSGHESNPRS